MGRVGNALEGKYWCTLCNEIHVRVQGSEECVLKTGWHTVNGETYNIGLCNGVHRAPNAPKYLGGQDIIPKEAPAVTR